MSCIGHILRYNRPFTSRTSRSWHLSFDCQFRPSVFPAPTSLAEPHLRLWAGVKKLAGTARSQTSLILVHRQLPDKGAGFRLEPRRCVLDVELVHHDLKERRVFRASGFDKLSKNNMETRRFDFAKPQVLDANYVCWNHGGLIPTVIVAGTPYWLALLHSDFSLHSSLKGQPPTGYS